MTAFQKAEALAGQRYDRDTLLALVHEVTTHFRTPNSFERSKMRAVCRHLADALDYCSGSTLQQRWNDFEKRFWLKWKAGIDRRGGTYWTWGARVLISARMIVPSLDMLANVRVNQRITRSRSNTVCCSAQPLRLPGLHRLIVISQFAAGCDSCSLAVTTACAI